MTNSRGLTRRNALIGMLAGLTAMLNAPVAAREYPNKPISIVVPYSAGGPTDTSARALGEEMSKVLGVPVVIENRPSAGGLIAATQVANAPKDGYTLLLSVGTIVSTNPHLYESLPYKTSDFSPISQYARWPYVISAPANFPASEPADLRKLAASRKHGLSFGTVGTGTQSHIVAAWVARELGIKADLVPYKGVSQAVADLSSGRIDLLTDGVSTGVANHNGKITKILASMGDDTFFMPDGVKTFAMSGYPELIAYSTFGLAAPAGTPEPVIQRLYQAVSTVLNTKEVAEKMRLRGEQPALSASPEAYGKLINEESERWGRLIRELDIKLD